MPYTISDLENFVRDCYLDYAAAGIEVGDPLYEWDDAHHPLSEKLGGITKVYLIRRDHAIHGVIQSEVLQYPCIWGWERPHLPEEYLDLYDKWKKRLCVIGGTAGGNKSSQEGKGIHSVEYKSSDECKEKNLRAGNANTPKQKEGRAKGGKKSKSEGKGIFAQTKEDKKNLAVLTNKQKWMCTITGYITNPGLLTRYQKAKGIDKSNRVRIE